MFEQVIKNNLGSFRNIKRSVPKVKTSIYIWFRKYLGAKDWDEEMTLVQKIFLHNGNRKVFEAILANAIDTYKTVRDKEIQKRVEASEQYYDFDIQIECFYNQYADERVKAKKYVYEPCYLNTDRSSPERAFEKFLDENANKIVWWWKNGENKKDYFGIKYLYPEGVINTFYPDYLVQFSGGKLGIFETKDQGDRDGKTYTKAKAEKLQEYIKEQNAKGRKLIGGIVIQRKGAWEINQKPVYNWDKCERGDWGDWQDLEVCTT